MAERDPSTDGAGCAPSPLVTRTLLGCLAGLVAVEAAKLGHLGGSGFPKSLIDFDTFHIVGRLALRGEIAQAYSFESMHRAQVAATGSDSFMPWTYPPPFNVVVAALGLMPLWLAYLAFTGTTLGAFLLVLRRLSGEAFGQALLATAPALAITIACGQNGFLTGALMGLACLALARPDARGAGVPLGLMVIKPHLALGLGLYALAARRRSVVITAAVAAAGICLFATLAFGTSVWTAFLGGATEAGRFLEAGLYPLYRMISVYAWLATLGVPPKAAFLAQGLTAGLVLAGLGLAHYRRMPPRQMLGFALLAGLCVSPYAYDYDLPIATLGLALLMPDLIRLTRPRERAALFALSWTACGWGLVQSSLVQARYGSGNLPDDVQPLSLGGMALILLLVALWRVLARERGMRIAPAFAPGQAGVAA